MEDRPKDRVTRRNELEHFCEELRREGKRIGFTSGVFDLLHSGHATYLEAAKAECDVLIVAVNSDASVRRLKGPSRPVRDEQDRVRLVASLAPVDYAFLFDEDNNNRNIELLRPHLYFKAGEYKKEQLSSAALIERYGGSVRLVGYLQGRSTTEIIDTILERHGVLGTTASRQLRQSKRPAVFLDRDGTLIEHVEYLSEPEKVRLLPGVIDGLRRLREAGFALVIVTNQPGIGLGYFTKEDLFRVHKELLRQLSERGILIDKVYYSPFGKADGAACRKPATGMIERAMQDMRIDLERSFVIGDTLADAGLATNAGVRSILVGESETGQASGSECDYRVPDIASAADLILQLEGTAAPGSGSYHFHRDLMLAERRFLQRLGMVVARIGHDFNNVLGTIRGVTELVRSRLQRSQENREEYERPLKMAEAAIERGLGMTSKLRVFQGDSDLPKEVVSAAEVVRAAVREVSLPAELPELDLRLDENLFVEVSRPQVARLLQEIVTEAVQSSINRGDANISIELEHATARPLPAGDLDGDWVHISISDGGEGVRSAFGPGWLASGCEATDAAEAGLDVVLLMTKLTVEQYGGGLAVEMGESGGATVHLWLPRCESPL